MIAGWLLVAAFGLHVPLQYTHYFDGVNPLEKILFLSPNPSSDPLLFVRLAGLLSEFTFSWIGLVSGILTLALSRKVYGLIGALFFIAKVPLEAPFRYVFEGLSIQGAIDIRLGGSPVLAMANIGVLLAVVAALLALTSKPLKENQTGIDNLGHKRLIEMGQPMSGMGQTVKPVAYDTQSGRPIFGYDVNTGQPIFVEPAAIKKTD